MFMWCPYHTAIITGIDERFYSKEPWNTLNQVIVAAGQIRAQFDSYDWGDDMGGGDSFIDILTTLPDDSPYNGAPIDIMPDAVLTYSTFCTTQLDDVVGTRLTPPICFMFN